MQQRTLFSNRSNQTRLIKRSTHCALRVARIIADSLDSTTVQTAHVAEALQYRRVLT
jgi:magnesium chelatase family protein